MRNLISNHEFHPLTQTTLKFKKNPHKTKKTHPFGRQIFRIGDGLVMLTNPLSEENGPIVSLVKLTCL